MLEVSMRLLASPLHPPKAGGDDRSALHKARLWLPKPVPIPTPPRRPMVTVRRRPWACLGSDPRLLAAIGSWEAAAGGILVALPTELTRSSAAILLRAVRHAVGDATRLVLLHRGAGGASLLLTLRREAPAVDFVSIEANAPTPAALASAQALATAPPPGLAEVSVDADGLATTTSWTRAAFPTGKPPLAPDDLVVVTGGLGGIGCAIAQRLVRRFGVHPVLLDSADPSAAPARESLEQLRATGRPFTHVAVDVTDEPAVRSALSAVTAGRPVVAVIHCAGVIEGGPVHRLTAADLTRLMTPKVTGLQAVLTALHPPSLRVVLAFGSILARVPHPGVGSYALANELLRREVDRCATRLPGPRYLTAEWSVWDGAGVAAQTGAVAQARQAGYSPIALADGLAAVERLLAWRGPETSVLVSETTQPINPSDHPASHPASHPANHPANHLANDPVHHQGRNS
jgi:enediyne polyketide synthase